ncbi:MAG: amidohydrolase family protein [Huintestinicola sp.]
MIIYNAEIHPVCGKVIPCGYAVISDKGRITAVKSGSPDSISSEDIDAKGLRMYPGFIDIHTHMGFIGDGAGEEGIDVNEGSDPVMPHLRSIDGINFRDGYFADAVMSGVTSVVTGVGSLNPIGGDMIALKTAGRCLEDAFIRVCGIKFALGENPKSWYNDREEAPQTRMATAALIREALYKAKRYMSDLEAAEKDVDIDPPDYDIKSEALIPLLKGEIKAHFHCHRADDIMTALRLCEEFGLDPLLVHCTEGHLIADLISEKKCSGAAVGPIICDRGKPELANASPKNAAILAANGIKTAICTDHPENPINYLTTGAAVCIKNGLPEEEALKAVTQYAAELAGISHRTGTIAEGKDADIILLDGSPFDIMTNVKLTVIDGKIVYRNEI